MNIIKLHSSVRPEAVSGRAESIQTLRNCSVLILWQSSRPWKIVAVGIFSAAGGHWCPAQLYELSPVQKLQGRLTFFKAGPLKVQVVHSSVLLG